MRPPERQARIADRVRFQGKATVEELAELFGASVETIRRDLNALSQRGKLEKVHGGAIPPRYAGEEPFDERMRLHGPAKRQIARLTRDFVSPGDTLLIDTGSTTLVLAEELGAIDDLTVVTNSTSIARVVAAGNRTAQLILLGGNYRANNRQTCGIMAIEQLERFYGDVVILTAGAVEAGKGIMDFDLEEAHMARAMMRHAERKIVLADSSKFDRSAPQVVCRLDEIDALICEQAPQGALSHSLEQSGVEVYS